MGDMDFKVAGTEEGITALQMDIKIQGIPLEVMKAGARAGARRPAVHPRQDARRRSPRRARRLSPYAPRMYRLQIDPQKIGTVIGPGGKMIRSIIEETGATIDIEDDGSVFIGAANDESRRSAPSTSSRAMTKDVEVGADLHRQGRRA